MRWSNDCVLEQSSQPTKKLFRPLLMYCFDFHQRDKVNVICKFYVRYTGHCISRSNKQRLTKKSPSLGVL
jgi:hypothetical protein